MGFFSWLFGSHDDEDDWTLVEEEMGHMVREDEAVRAYLRNGEAVNGKIKLSDARGRPLPEARGHNLVIEDKHGQRHVVSEDNVRRIKR